jgi:cytochrome c553
MKRGWLLAAVSIHVCLTTANPAVAQSAPPKPDLARAQQIVTQICAACHGVEGVSAAPVNPHLAAQHAEYTALQLDNFKTGLRKNPVMMAMAANLTPEESRSIGVYFASKKPKPGAAKDKDLAELGQRIYRGGNSKTGLPACSSCHLPTGGGVPTQYPRLAGQFADYTYAQLQGFVKGDRGGEVKTSEGKLIEDRSGSVMAAIAAKMNDREMRAVAEYVSGLR